MSSSRPPDLPDFAKPPVAEVVLSLQFGALSSLTTAHVGLLWRKYRDLFPLIEEHLVRRHRPEWRSLSRTSRRLRASGS